MAELQSIGDLLNEISKKDGKKTVDELKGELDGLLAELKTKAPNEDEQKLKDIAVNQLRSKYRKKLFSGNKGTEFKGTFIKVGRKIDMVKKRRNIILEAYNADPESAKERGMVDSEGNPLNYESSDSFNSMPDWKIKYNFELFSEFVEREKKAGRNFIKSKEEFLTAYVKSEKITDEEAYEKFVKEEKENKAGKLILVKEELLNKVSNGERVIGKAIPETDYSRTCLGIVYIEGKPVKMKINLRKNNTDVIPELFKKTTFNGYKKQTSTDDNYLLNDNGVFAPKYEGDLDEETTTYILENVYGDSFKTLEELDQFIIDTAEIFDATLVTKVNVIEIPAIETKTGTKLVTVSDDTVALDKIFTCWIPKEMEINFADTAQIYIIGSANKNDETNAISINVAGIYVPPIFRNELPNSESVGTKSEISGGFGDF